MPPLRFSEYIDSSDEFIPGLPLMHTCKSKVFRVIVSQHQPSLNVTVCDEFVRENLLYSYYGKPSYRVDSSNNSSQLLIQAPECLILSPDNLPTPKRVYPFDSGGFVHGIYEHHLPKEDFKHEAFSLTPDISTPGRIVSRYFRNNEQYYHGSAKEPLAEGSPMDFESQAYLNMIMSRSSLKEDDRGRTIEIQFSEDVILSRDSLLTIVMPEEFGDEDSVRTLCTEVLKIKPITYTVDRDSGRERVGAIKSKVRDYLFDSGYLE